MNKQKMMNDKLFNYRSFVMKLNVHSCDKEREDSTLGPHEAWAAHTQAARVMLRRQCK